MRRSSEAHITIWARHTLQESHEQSVLNRTGDSTEEAHSRSRRDQINAPCRHRKLFPAQQHLAAGLVRLGPAKTNAPMRFEQTHRPEPSKNNTFIRSLRVLTNSTGGRSKGRSPAARAHAQQTVETKANVVPSPSAFKNPIVRSFGKRHRSDPNRAL